MKKNPTLKDLAQKLGLSISTVSRALQNNSRIKKDTIARTKKLAKEMGYLPDVLAKSLKNNKTHTIGVIVPEISHVFFSSVIDGIEEITYKDGYTILVAKSNENIEREVLNTDSLISNRVAGVIASISQETKNGKHFNQILDRGIPLVLFDRVLDDLAVPKIVGDDFEKVYEIVNHLIDSGYRNIAYLAGPPHLKITVNRMEGYKKALIDNGLDIRDEMILNVNLDEKGGFNGARSLLKQLPRLDAICCVNDPVAVGVYQQLNKVGLKIPEDVGVTGFSNNPITEIISPTMTTVDQQGYEMGRKAAEILLDQINDKGLISLDQTHIIESKLIIRESSSRKIN
jgi:LacI family transcriptional regulator